MTVRRMSISVPEEVEVTIKTAAAAAGQPISTWLTAAAQQVAAEQAAIADGLAAIAELEAEHGPLSAETREHARQILTNAGVIAPPTQRMVG